MKRTLDEWRDEQSRMSYADVYEEYLEDDMLDHVPCRLRSGVKKWEKNEEIQAENQRIDDRNKRRMR